MIHRIVALLTALSFALLAGCGGDRIDAATHGPGIHGLLRDESGAAMARSEVLACMATTCLFGTTDEKGRFSFVVDAPAEVAIKTREDLDANPRRGAALCPVRVLGSSSVDVGDVHVPTLATGSSIATADRDPQTLVAGAGVELVLSRSQLVSSGHPLTDVAAAAVPKQEIPMLTDLAGEKVVAAFALHPFGVKSNAPIAFKAPVNLPNGTVVKIRTISDLDGRLSGAVPGRAEDGFVTTDPGRGITELTWVVIST